MGARVRFLGLLKEFQPDSDDQGFWKVPIGTTIKEIAEKTGVDSSKWDFVITVNGESVLRSYALKDNDELIFSTIFLGG
ncbi:MAG: hypothetical protein FWG21_03940 [Oscillospiraceae bacterium]|nr:hypothetical protein [Oscillospiraceae bacterium]